MGRSTYADVVPYAVHNLWHSNDVVENIGMESSLFEPHLHWEYTGEVETQINGWSLLSADLEAEGYPNTGIMEYGKHKRIIVSTGWEKDNNIVWVINESEYVGADCVNITLVSDSREALEGFLNEIIKAKCPNITIPPLEENDSVQQTL
jgi:hypothetical protein